MRPAGVRFPLAPGAAVCDTFAMSQQVATVRRITRKGLLGRMAPRTFSRQGRHRFDRDRRASLVARCGGKVTERQALIIDQMVAAEWGALLAERDAARAPDPKDRAVAGKVATEARRLLLLLDRDLDRATPAPAPPAPVDPMERFRAAVAARQGGTP
jgi:hypothetical protein